ncbi:MAG: hypothetical protein HY303_01895 [Candidatus Wallbacteria bacterium]|nr:hypothetical protein [Candidatus Wallbacteria bacterium]
MNEDTSPRENRAGLEQEQDDLDVQLRRLGSRRIQLFLMMMPFLAALCWTLFYACQYTFDVIKSPDANPRAWFELVFWSIITGLVAYVVYIVGRERASTVSRFEDMEKRLGRLRRRMQQLAIEEAGVKSEGPHAGRAHPSAPSHAQTSREAAPRAPAHAEHNAAPQGAAGHRPPDRGPIVLDLDAATDTKECPMCAETVRAKAKICRYCRHEFDATAG